MGVGGEEQERGRAPLDFYTWYSIDRGLKVLFFGIFLFFRCPLPKGA